MARLKRAVVRRPRAAPARSPGLASGAAPDGGHAPDGGQRFARSWGRRSCGRRSSGIVLVALAAICWSTAGLFVRWLALDMWTIAFWRGLFAALLLALVACAMDRLTAWRGVWRIGLPELAVAACAAISILAFIPALRMTSVANVAIIYSTAPVLTAVMASLFLGEVFQRAMIPSGVLIAAGTCLVVWGGGFGAGLLGNLLAVVMTLTMAGVGLMVRGLRDRPLVAPFCLANVAVALAAMPLASPLAPGDDVMLVLILFALVQVALAFVLFALGAPKIPASEAAMIGTVEAPLAPLWVLLAFGEMPPPATIAGGAIILGATLAYLRAVPASAPPRSTRMPRRVALSGTGRPRWVKQVAEKCLAVFREKPATKRKPKRTKRWRGHASPLREAQTQTHKEPS